MAMTGAINKENFSKGKEVFLNVAKDKRFQLGLTIIIFLLILISSSDIRTSNLDLLKDETTDDYIPTALDPYYFLRMTETILEEGGRPEEDIMRFPSSETSFHPEIWPGYTVWIYHGANLFGDYSIRYIAVIFPVIFFALTLIAFFAIIYILTKSKSTALISCALLAYIPSYLYRSMAGFYDHESNGTFFFLLTLIVFTFAIKFLSMSKDARKDLLKSVGYGLLVALFSALTMLNWRGIANFVFMVIPLAFFILYLVKSKKEKNLWSYLIFFFLFIFATPLFTHIMGYDYLSVFERSFLSTQGLINIFVLGFIAIDISVVNLLKKKQFSNIVKKYRVKEYRVIYSLIFLILLAIILFTLSGRNIFKIVYDIIRDLLQPFGQSRVGGTVAENRPANLDDWISQKGRILLWLFYIGMVIIGFEIARGLRESKNMIFFGLAWLLMISGILFNGSLPKSEWAYLFSLLIFAAVAGYVYLEDEFDISPELIVITSWMFFMLIGGSGAVRLFFVTTPLVCFISGYSFFKSLDYTKATKDKDFKIIFAIATLIILAILVFASFGFYVSSSSQAERTGPGANLQWQRSMQWVREETPEDSLFLHWWDYGYWVQTLGERTTIADGGHVQQAFQNHLIGRHVLTTPRPETALSYMKTHDVTHLLIDPTDLGKYGAYSKIGSGPEGVDRESRIPIIPVDERQTEEKANSTIKFYSGGSPIDKDIIYREDGKDIFIHEGFEVKNNRLHHGLGGVRIEYRNNNNTIKNAKAIFLNKGDLVELPLRYVYLNGDIIDFGRGINATLRILPSIEQDQRGTSVNRLGSVIYLSEKTTDSLFAQIYLMDDPHNRYPSLQVAHKEDDMTVESLKMQGLDVKDFIYYRGLRGPIKIWDVSYPDNIETHKMLLERDHDFGDGDNLEFVKE